MSDQDILIKIVTAYSEGGLEKARKAAEDLKKSCKDSAGGSDTLSKAMEVLSSKGGDAGKTIRGLFDLMNKDGPGAVAGLGKSIEGLASTFGMALGPAGAIASIAMAGFQVVKGIMDAHKKEAEEAAKAAQEAAERAKKAAEEAREALARGLADEADKTRDKIMGIAEAFTEAANKAKALDDAKSAVGDAQLALDLAEIDAKIATASPKEAAELQQQKARLKANRDQEKIQAEIDRHQGQLADMDTAEKKAGFAVRDTAVDEKDFRDWHAAQVEVESAQDKVTRLEHQVETGEATPAQLRGAKRQLEARQAEFAEVSARDNGQLGAKAARHQAAIDAERELREQNAPQREVLQAQIDAARIRQRTRGVQLDTETSRIQRTEDERAKAQREREAEEERKKAEDAAAAAAEANKPPDPTVGSLWRDASGQIQRGQRYQGQLYDIDNGQIQAKARQALADAGKAMAAGKSGDDAQIIADLVAALEEMGAVVNDRNKMLQDLQQAVALMRQQAKNARG